MCSALRRAVRPPGNPTATLRISSPAPGIFAYYDGRTGDRLASDAPNWLDEGAFTLGVATYSIVDGDEALLFDAAITTDHAAAMLEHVRGLGVTKTTTVYSHFHNDHIAGAPALQAAGSTFVGNTITATTIQNRTVALATDFPPIIAIVPTQLYDNQTTVKVGSRVVELHNFNIHTPDGTVLFLREEGILLAGDTVEDTATFIAEAPSLSVHQQELQRMAQLPIRRILPAHGSPDRISAGGYDPSFIEATLRYIRAVDEPVAQPAAWTQTLEQVVAQDVAAGKLIYFAQYEVVHQSNVQAIQDARSSAGAGTAV